MARENMLWQGSEGKFLKSHSGKTFNPWYKALEMF